MTSNLIIGILYTSADDYTCSHEAMTSDEVVGYYVECHGEMAYTRWKENLRIKGHNTNLDTVVELKLRGLQMIQ